MEPKILAETEDQRRRLVELDAIHAAEYEMSSVQYLAGITQSGVEFHRMSNTEPSTKFWLDACAADAFCTAWIDFKNAQIARAKAEEERQNTIIAEAYAIARKHTEISIKEIDDVRDDEDEAVRSWIVSIPETGWNCPETGWNCGMYPHWSYSADELLGHTKDALSALQGRFGQATFTGGDAA